MNKNQVNFCCFSISNVLVDFNTTILLQMWVNTWKTWTQGQAVLGNGCSFIMCCMYCMCFYALCVYMHMFTSLWFSVCVSIHACYTYYTCKCLWLSLCFIAMCQLTFMVHKRAVEPQVVSWLNLRCPFWHWHAHTQTRTRSIYVCSNDASREHRGS